MQIDMMLSEFIPRVIVAVLLSVSGVVGQDGWSVIYTTKRICALKGSTVDMPCTYSYPRGYSVKKALWFTNWPASSEPEDLSENPQYRGQVEYLGNKYHNCSFRIKDVTERDSATYRFRFLTKTADGRYTGQPGVTLTVTDLQVSVDPDTVTEGQSVTLTCRTTCTLTGSSAFIWYKNNQPLSFTSQEHQITVSSGDAGSYSCAVRGYENLPSPAVTLSVEFECLRVETDSDTVTEGQGVTLTCRTICAYLSNSEYFHWYKNGQYQYHHTSYSRQLQFTASSEKAGRYSCGVWDLLSSAVTISVKYPPKNTSVSVSPSGEVKEGSSVTLTCSSDANPPVQSYTWFMKTGAVTLERGWEQRYTITDLKLSDSGEYYCKVWNSFGENQSLPKPLSVQYAPKNTSVSVSPSGEIEEGSSVTLTCSSDANPPVHRCTWFKKTGAVTSERGTGESYTIANISSEDSGQYYCEAQNQHGALSSPAMTIDVQYPPKNTSVSVSPSGEIEEGSSVTLTCSSDANPAVHRYTWFKRSGAVTSERGTGESYTITNISSEDSGQYYCEAQNQHGALNSTAVTVDVQYAPRNTSVSVSLSGDIEEGSSVTLTCSSDANPPVHRYTWFMKNESGVWQIGSGQSLNFSNFRSWSSGLYYCETENKHGALNSTALPITKQGGPESTIFAAVGTTACVALVLLAVIVWMRWRKSTESQTTEADREDNKSPVYGNISEMALSHTAAQDTNRDEDEAVLYSTVQPVTIRNQEEGLYSTVKPAKISSYHYGDIPYPNGQEPHPQAEDEVRYASIKFTSAPSSAVHSGEGESVIYSTINKYKHQA